MPPVRKKWRKPFTEFPFDCGIVVHFPNFLVHSHTHTFAETGFRWKYPSRTEGSKFCRNNSRESRIVKSSIHPNQDLLLLHHMQPISNADKVNKPGLYQISWGRLLKHNRRVALSALNYWATQPIWLGCSENQKSSLACGSRFDSRRCSDFFPVPFGSITLLWRSFWFIVPSVGVFESKPTCKPQRGWPGEEKRAEGKNVNTNSHDIALYF